MWVLLTRLYKSLRERIKGEVRFKDTIEREHLTYTMEQLGAVFDEFSSENDVRWLIQLRVALVKKGVLIEMGGLAPIRSMQMDGILNIWMRKATLSKTGKRMYQDWVKAKNSFPRI
jgi:hypothetical protein